MQEVDNEASSPIEARSSNDMQVQREAAGFTVDIVHDILNEIPMSVFCACDCNAASTQQDEFNERLYLQPSWAKREIQQESCNSIFDTYGYSCGKPVADSKRECETYLSELYRQQAISIEEYELMELFLNDIYHSAHLVDYSAYLSAWESIPGSSPTNGNISGVSFRITENVVNYFASGIYDPNDGGNDEGDVEALIGKALATLGGAWWGAITAVIRAEQEFYHDDFGYTIAEEAMWGGAGAALLSL